MSNKKSLKLALAVAAAVAAPGAFATNGMNMQGYGPIAYGMGGASMAYDNGTAATMNNPATLGLMDEGNRVDIAFGILAPDVDASMTGMPTADSSGGPYKMPAVGYARKSGAMTYGFGVFAQGGMGTEYEATSFMSAGSGQKTGSELSVGRLILPIAYSASSNLKIGGSIDYVFAGLDLNMALSGGQFIDMVPGFGTQTYGTVSNTMVTTFGGLVSTVGNNVLQGPGSTIPGSPVNWGRFDFSNTDDFTGQSKGGGFAGKIGMVYKISNQLAIGASYHSKTAMSDLEAGGASVSFNANVDNNVLLGGAPTGAGYTAVTIPVTGGVKVRDFEWPATIALGIAYQVTDAFLFVADYKQIQWADVMKDFKLTFTADATQANPLAGAFAGTVIDATMFQNWEDQNVIQLGGAYKMSDAFTLRFGLNVADSPIPDKYLNPLFPAIMETHYTVGFGYAMSKAETFDFGFAYAPPVEQTNGSGVTSSVGGKSMQVMYSNRF
jgi:long-chain fatty acid transport protein